MHEKLKKSPLTYVLAQIKFNDIVGVGDKIGELQETIRDDFSELKTQSINVIDLARGERKITNIWHFLDKTFTCGIMVSTDSIVIHTSKYISFEDMIEKAEKIFTKFNEILKIQLYTRIGLRYVNLIRGSIHRYLRDGLLGYQLPENNVFEKTYIARSETMQKTKYGNIKVNSMHISNASIMDSENIYISPDLSQGAMFLSFEHHKGKIPKQAYVMLDIDHFASSNGDFVAKDIVNKIEELHEGVFIAFRNAITPETWEKWK